MKVPKDGFYTVYLLPAENYVGQTGNFKNRLANHKSAHNRNTSNYKVLAEVSTIEEALKVEEYYHSKGYKGKQITTESRILAVANTDYAAKVANTDYIARTLNFDYASKVANMDYAAKAKKCMKPILQFSKDGEFIREWSSNKEASLTLGINKGNITNCCKGRYKTAGGYKFNFKNIKDGK